MTRVQVDRVSSVQHPADLPARRQGALKVVVAVATYLRPTDIARCLQSVLAERTRYLGDHPGDSVRVLVVDNDAAGSACDAVTGVGAGHEVSYVVEPAPGISAARNRALAEALDDDLLTFIDDDEEVRPDWLGHLVRTWETWRPVAVAGRVISDFSSEPEAWIDAGGFFRRRTLPTGTLIDVAATNNLLLDLAAIRKLDIRFPDYYGLIGGTDHHFTRELVKRGHSIIWCDEAVVVDHVPSSRATREWVLARARRTGNSDVVVALRLADGPLGRARSRLLAFGRGAYRVVGGVVATGIGRATGSLRYDAKGAKAISRGCGMVLGALGHSVAEYQRPAVPPTPQPYGSPIRVLASFREPRPTTNPYISQLATALDRTTGVTLLRFSWRVALFDRYDAVHLHWPEVLLQSPARSKRYARRLLFAMLLVRWRLSGTAIVRTLHNVEPHDRLDAMQRVLLHRLDAQTARRIALNPADAGAPDVVLIPHGHYRDIFDESAIPVAIPGRVVFAGLIRKYKNVPALVRAFRGVSLESVSLHVVGALADDRLAAEIRDAAFGDDRVSLRLRFLETHELIAEIGQAQLVALPYNRMHNSGAVLLALSLRRPVLVPDSPVNRLLADEVGRAWVSMYVGELTSEAIEQALAAAPELAATDGPDLSSRSWSAAGEAHARVFRTAAQSRQRRPRTSGV